MGRCRRYAGHFLKALIGRFSQSITWPREWARAARTRCPYRAGGGLRGCTGRSRYGGDGDHLREHPDRLCLVGGIERPKLADDHRLRHRDWVRYLPVQRSGQHYRRRSIGDDHRRRPYSHRASRDCLWLAWDRNGHDQREPAIGPSQPMPRKSPRAMHGDHPGGRGSSRLGERAELFSAVSPQ
jgi:hypothetical protein